jgi:hypothetical protein
LVLGKLGLYLHKQVHFDLIEGTRLYHGRLYLVPHLQLELLKDKLDHLCQVAVLSRCEGMEWAAPTFIIPKKDGRVRWISNFRELNKVLIHKPYPLPRIQDNFTRCPGYTLFTNFDISMQYYTFKLDEEAKDLRMICTPFGLYRYNHLPMGVKQSPDIAQQLMEMVLKGVDKKIANILKMDRPQNVKQVCSFLGAVTYFCL